MSFDDETPTSSPPGTPIPYNVPPIPQALGHPVPMTPWRCDALDRTLTQWCLLLRSYCSACEAVLSCLRRDGFTIGLHNLLGHSRDISGRLSIQASHYSRRASRYDLTVSARIVYRDWFVFWNCVGVAGVYQGAIAREYKEAMLEMRDNLWVAREQYDPENAMTCLVDAAQLLERVNADLSLLFLGH